MTKMITIIDDMGGWVTQMKVTSLHWTTKFGSPVENKGLRLIKFPDFKDSKPGHIYLEPFLLVFDEENLAGEGLAALS